MISCKFLGEISEITQTVLLISSHSTNRMVGSPPPLAVCRVCHVKGELPSFDVDAALAALEDETDVKLAGSFQVVSGCGTPSKWPKFLNGL